jgi:uncharacterized protein YoxC
VPKAAAAAASPPVSAPAVEKNTPAGVPPQAPPAESPARSSGSHPGWIALVLIALSSSCLAVFLTLAILGAVNQGLSYASQSDMNALQSQVDTLQTQVNSLDQDLAGLRARVDALEVLAARTTELEKMALNLQAEIDKRVSEAQQLKDKVNGIQTSITDVVAQSKAFQDFMDGLKGLVNKINPGGQKP